MGAKPSRIKLRTGRNSDNIDAAGFMKIMEDNWDTLREDIMAINEDERPAALTNLSDKIPSAKPLLEIMYNEDGDLDEFKEACSDLDIEVIKEIAGKFEELKLVNLEMVDE